MTYKQHTDVAIRLLAELIATPSISRNESAAADIIERELLALNASGGGDAVDAVGATAHAVGAKGYGEVKRVGNNVWIVDPEFDAGRPTLLLNAHIDTVKPTDAWTLPPFEPTFDGDRLYGLGSNDCGGGLVALMQAYMICIARPRAYNLIYLASAEEEVSGANGIVLALPHLPKIDVAIVGEPTAMQPAIAEKGLMVIDGVAHGKAGHAARNEGVNAINEALDDLVWLRDCRFERVSPLLGPVKVSVTMINAGTQHNVVPDACRYVIDVRTNELYTNEEAFGYLQSHVRSTLTPRSFRLSSSHIAADHPLVQRCMAMGMTPFGSPTLSDQALMPFPSLKLGPGDSARSHTANEFVCLSEIGDAIEKYTQLIAG